MSIMLTYTPEQRKQAFDNKYYGKNKISFVIDRTITTDMPSVEKSDVGFDIICTEYQKFNMLRRDDSLYWDHFYSVAGIPKTYEKKEASK